VGGVGVEGDVAHHTQLRVGGLDGLDGARNQAVGIGRFQTVGGLEVVFNVWEQGHHRDAELDHLAAELQKFIDREAVDAGHRRNRRDLVAFLHEHRKDEVVDREHVFAHQAAGKVVMAHAAHAHEGILTEGLHFVCFLQKSKAAVRPAGPSDVLADRSKIKGAAAALRRLPF
jgi:hypothetical protein